ncbi:UDP-glycosyltransferase UGT5-like [Schistocerca cancellata]|uniref:UDP-glycosyltransferase UGT5-like n=1 Tax=Schistocerca cancellata TaxID=274614 RepID=UPI00211989BE|nr:UDP-glycosyltransferase UGT5-like [Schistocerca cancellata]
MKEPSSNLLGVMYGNCVTDSQDDGIALRQRTETRAITLAIALCLNALHEKKFLISSSIPQDIQQFLDGAEEGFIFFSLGSNIKSSNLPETMRNNLMKAFAQIPQRVLWKFELDNLPGKPDNVMISKWLPQRDILAHRNIRLFFTHGGLLSFSEAAYFGVPLLAMPVFGDQRYNVAKMTSAGVGEKIEFGELTTDSVLRAIRHVIENPSYQENMKRLSAVYREHQSTSLERAVWWVEYVIRQQGAPHLRSAALNLHWWQLLLLDVIAFILAVAAVAAFLLFKVVVWPVFVARESTDRGTIISCSSNILRNAYQAMYDNVPHTDQLQTKEMNQAQMQTGNNNCSPIPSGMKQGKAMSSYGLPRLRKT